MNKYTTITKFITQKGKKFPLAWGKDIKARSPKEAKKKLKGNKYQALLKQV